MTPTPTPHQNLYMYWDLLQNENNVPTHQMMQNKMHFKKDGVFAVCILIWAGDSFHMANHKSFSVRWGDVLWKAVVSWFNEKQEKKLNTQGF